MFRTDRHVAQAIAGVARALQGQHTSQETLQRMVHLAVATVPGCEHAGVSIITGSTISTAAASGDVPPAVDRIQYEVNQGPCLDAIRNEAVFQADDLASEDRWPDFSARAARETSVRSMLSFRLFDEQGTLGALTFYSGAPAAFSADSRAVGALFATHAAVALVAALGHDEALRLGLELAQAKQQNRTFVDQANLALALQRSMITDLPQPEHFELAGVYRPAARGNEVGGDFYDAFVAPDGTLRLVIGDVVGHDVRAAAAMGALRNVLRGIAYDRMVPLSEILERVDGAIEGLAMDGMATLLLAAVRQNAEEQGSGRRRLWWSNAGHLQPVLIHADGRAELLTGVPDLIMGVDRSWRRSVHSRLLPPGSTLVLYTDGLIERRREHLGTSLDRLLTIAADVHRAGLPVREMVDELVHRCLANEDAHQDDTAVLAVRVHQGR